MDSIKSCFFFFKSITARGIDDGRQPEAEENQGVDMIGTKKLRGRKKYK
jgi:hypothetical protein